MTKVKSDPTLVTEIRKYGKFDTNACFQCGSCTITCDLTDNYASFPRRLVRYALLGLKKPLMSSLEPWLCYYCGDCSITCPRQTEPGEAMMTLRRYLTTQYDWTGLSAKIYRSKAWEIGSLFLVGLFVLLLVVLYHVNVVGMELPEFASQSMGMEHMFGKIAIFTRLVFITAYFFLLSNAFRMYRFTIRSGGKVKIPFYLYFTEAWILVQQALTQKRFGDCKEEEKSHWVKHWFLIPAFIVMFFILVFFLDWFQTDNVYPIYHPQRWLGYFVAGALTFAAVHTLVSRLQKRKQLHKHSTHTDWILPIMLLLTTVTGLAVHIFRYLEFSLLSHYTYALHLAIAVPMLVIELPFGKWTHMIYRPMAIYFLRVKEKALQQQQQPGEAILDHAG
jgi:nitrate reductase gamma subunit